MRVGGWRRRFWKGRRGGRGRWGSLLGGLEMGGRFVLGGGRGGGDGMRGGWGGGDDGGFFFGMGVISDGWLLDGYSSTKILISRYLAYTSISSLSFPPNLISSYLTRLHTATGYVVSKLTHSVIPPSVFHLRKQSLVCLIVLPYMKVPGHFV